MALNNFCSSFPLRFWVIFYKKKLVIFHLLFWWSSESISNWFVFCLFVTLTASISDSEFLVPVMIATQYPLKIFATKIKKKTSQRKQLVNASYSEAWTQRRRKKTGTLKYIRNSATHLTHAFGIKAPKIGEQYEWTKKSNASSRKYAAKKN